MRQPETGKDYYSILGAEEDASPGEIERLYKRLAVRHHPDRGGDEEAMKSINEAYRVLRHDDARRAYDDGRRPPSMTFVAPSVSPGAKADAVSGRIVGAVLCVVVGLALLLLVSFQYMWFLWPLAILAGFVTLLGVLMAHAALVFAREGCAPTHPARRYVWAQETAFWSAVGGGIYGIYLLISAI